MSKTPTIYRESFRLGVLVDAPVQLLDLAPVDLFHMLGASYMSTISLLPEVVRRHAVPEVSIKYIAKDATQKVNRYSSTHLVELTANLTIQATASLDSPDVQPGSIDVLVIPGPDPNKVTDEAICAFVRSHAQSGKTDIITVCTGIFPAAYSGILDGRTVTGPRGLLPELRKKFPKVKKWEEARWSTDRLGTTKGNGRQAELWTSAGITNGHDVIAAYIREHFGREIADCVLAMADVEDRTREYDVGSVRETGWWLWLIIRSIFNQPHKK